MDITRLALARETYKTIIDRGSSEEYAMTYALESAFNKKPGDDPELEKQIMSTEALYPSAPPVVSPASPGVYSIEITNKRRSWKLTFATYQELVNFYQAEVSPVPPPMCDVLQ